MAKRKKRVNTGLVGFITVMGMLLSVAVVAAITVSQAKRDPAQYAEMAATFEEAGDREQAIQRFIRAYQVDRESQYIIEAARVMLAMGRWQDAFGTLVQAHRAVPDDMPLVQNLLERLWDISEFGVRYWREIKEYSAKALGVWDRDLEDIAYQDAFETLENLESVAISEELRGLAVISLANVLTRLPNTNDRQAELANLALEIAQKSNPYDPRVVGTQVDQLYDHSKMPEAERERLEYLRQAQARALEFINAARTAAPQPELDVLAVRILSEDPLYSRDRGAYNELRRTEEALELLRSSLEQFAEDSELKTTFALTVVRYISDNQAAETPIHNDESRRLISEARTIIQAALDEDPGFYQGVDLLANLALIERDPTIDPNEDEIRRLREAVAIYDAHREEGVTAETLRAAFGGLTRLRMLFSGFRQALTLHQRLAADSPERIEANEALQRFNEALQTSYPEQIEAEWTAGTFAQLNNQSNEAIQQFTAVASHTDNLDSLRVRIIFDANQQLARLFYQRNQTGEAERYADAAIQASTRIGIAPSNDIQAIKLSIMIQDNRAQQALDQIENLLVEDPDNAVLNRVRTQALLVLNRTDEARASLDNTDDEFAELAKVRLAINEKNFELATTLLRDYLLTNQIDRSTVDLLVQAMMVADQADALLAFLNQISTESDDEAFQRWLESRKVFVTTRDPNERLDQLVSLISKQSDPAARATDLFSAYRRAGRTKKAQEALNQLEALRPNDIPVLDQQFRFALNANEIERAEEYARRLSALDADNADGARYRSELALAQGRAETALSELLIAESKLPPDADLKAQLARTYLMFDPRRMTEATTALEEALRLNPRHATALRLLFLIQAESGMSDDDPEYESLLRRAWSANPGDTSLRPFVDRLAEQLKPEEAIARREKQYAENPNDGENLLRLVALYQRPEIDQAQKAAELLIDAEKLYVDTDLTDPEASRDAWRYYQTVADFFGQRRVGGPPQGILDRLVERAPAERRSDAELVRAQFYFRVQDQEKTLAGYQAALSAVDAITDAQQRNQKRFNIQTALIRFYFYIGQFDEGLTLGEAALQQLGTSEQDVARSQALQLAMIEALIAVRPDEARRKLDAFRRNHPDDARGLTLFASLLLRQQQLEEAHDILTLILRDEPRNAWALDHRGGVNLQFSRFDEARRDLLAAKAEQPWGLNLRPRYRLARLYEIAEQPQLAESEYLEIIEAQPENLQAARLLLDFYRRTQQTEAASDMLSRLAARYPTQPFWSNQLGLLLLREENYSAALRPLEQAAELTEWRDHKAVSDWAFAAVFANRANDVLAKMEAVGANVPPIVLHSVLAAAHARLGQKAECEQAVQRALGLVVDQGARALRNLYQTLATRVPLDSLEAALDQKLADSALTDERRISLELLQVELYIVLNDFEAVRTQIEQIRSKLDPKSQNYATLLISEAQLLERIPETTLDQKRPVYEALIELEPDNERALNNLAFALAKAGAGAEAQQYVERLRALEVTNASILDTIGVVFMMNEKYDEALVQFQQALRQDPRSLDAHLHLSQLLIKKGERRDAINQLNRTIELSQALNNPQITAEARSLLAELESAR